MTDEPPALTSRRIFLTEPPPDFDPGRDLVIGPWCFVGVEDRFPGWDKLPFEEPVRSPAELKSACGDTEQLALLTAERLGRDIDLGCGGSHGSRYWRSLLYVWLMTCAQLLWRRYLHVSAMVERHGNEPFSVFVHPDRHAWPSLGLEEFYGRLERSRPFDHWVSSIVVRELCPPSWQLIEIREKPEPGSPIGRPTAARSRLRKLLGRLPFNHAHGVRAWKLPFSVMLSLLPRSTHPPDQTETETIDRNIEDRFPDAFLQLYERLAGATRPACYGADYSRWDASASQRRFVPGRLYIDNLGSHLTENNFLAATALERGERVVGAQHGGLYGTAVATPVPAHSEYAGHAFLTWGWKEQEDAAAKFVPVPSPHLSRIANAHRRGNRNLIFIGTLMEVYGNRFNAIPSPSRWPAYRRMKREFVGGLNDAIRDQLAYRPYEKNRTLLDAPYLQRSFPDLKVLEGPLVPEMLRSKLAVIDYPGTSFLESLAANVPTIAYWNPDDWPMSRQAAPYVDALADCGLLHRNASSAAAKVNEIWADVEGWWRGEAVQSARRVWCRQYARTAVLWQWHWAKALWQVAREPGIVSPIPDPIPGDDIRGNTIV